MTSGGQENKSRPEFPHIKNLPGIVSSAVGIVNATKGHTCVKHASYGVRRGRARERKEPASVCGAPREEIMCRVVPTTVSKGFKSLAVWKESCNLTRQRTHLDVRPSRHAKVQNIRLVQHAFLHYVHQMGQSLSRPCASRPFLVERRGASHFVP